MSDTTHQCGACGAAGVPDHQLMCPACWNRVPMSLRNDVQRSWKSYANSKGRPIRQRVELLRQYFAFEHDAIAWAQRKELAA